MDEDTDLKSAGAYKALVGSNPTASANLGVAEVGSSNDFENRSDPMKVSGSMPPSPATFLYK